MFVVFARFGLNNPTERAGIRLIICDTFAFYLFVYWWKLFASLNVKNENDSSV